MGIGASRRILPALRRAATVAALALLAVLAPARAQGSGEETARRAVLEMREAFQKGDAARLAALRPRLDGHLTEPLADYWLLRNRLERADTGEVRAVLARWAGSYWEDRLRNDWLLLLGARGDWATLLEEAPRFRMNDDPEVRCWVALAQVETGAASPASVAEAVRTAWLGQRTAAPGCARAAGRLIAAGALPAEVAWQRARLGVEAGRLAVATQAVALLDADWAALVERAFNAPQRYLDDKLTAVRHRTKEIVTLALIRLATQDPQAAAAHAEHLRWRAQLTAEERAWVWGAIGRRTALRLQPEALDHFARTWEAALPDEWRAWHVRAALRAGDWAAVRRAIGLLSPQAQQDPTWIYWLARALRASDQAGEAAQALLQRIAGPEGFYEQLAAEALGQPVTLPPAPPPPTAAERAAVRALPGLQRALLLIDWGLRTEGVREWHYEVALHVPGGLPERELLAAAAWACERAVWDRCINTSSRTRQQVDIAQRYPTPLRELVVPRARAIGLDPAYVYGLIRQESRFVMDARSHVGASGLMQVMPATARWTARRIGLRDFQPHQIDDPEVNVTIGTAYLKLALDDFEGSMALAAAAYNAGPGRPRQWRQGPVLEAAVWVENIPFDETRDYVKRVLANTHVYAALLTGQPQLPSARLGATIGPRLATARAPDTELP
ncbi:Soluble lytic murein transglycosylase [Tepidimonas sediminis]|uniref:Soluble lytic murein transglycosylase n=1 Tax=Tepidimonas sediminis TaxID=2588941 RepID=A0A554WPY2_9BURK|nr:lytic transglycosylase domain-containing protein [Tepidimonas sediminis]TSE25614.1 Soluble lytic murein transglycosylase [Tepidimonas sediminis]